MEGLFRDIRYAVRSLRKRPALSTLIVLVLALAIAANSSIFSIVNAVILKPLAFKQPEELVWIWAQRKTVSRAFFSIPNFIDTRDQNQTLAELAPFAIWPANLTGQGEAERLQGVRMSANGMQMLGVDAAAGRALVTGVGLIPLALGVGDPGKEIQQPMAIVILGGIFTSTFLNMIVIPALYLKYGRAQAPAPARDYPHDPKLAEIGD